MYDFGSRFKGPGGGRLARQAGQPIVPSHRAATLSFRRTAHQTGAALLHRHIAKEDNVLFPMAATVIAPGDHEKLLAAFQATETDPEVHDRYVGLAEKLE